MARIKNLLDHVAELEGATITKVTVIKKKQYTTTFQVIFYTTKGEFQCQVRDWDFRYKSPRWAKIISHSEREVIWPSKNK